MPTREEMLQTIHRVVGTASVAMKSFNVLLTNVCLIGNVIEYVNVKISNESNYENYWPEIEEVEKDILWLRIHYSKPISEQPYDCIAYVYSFANNPRKGKRKKNDFTAMYERLWEFLDDWRRNPEDYGVEAYRQLHWKKPYLCQDSMWTHRLSLWWCVARNAVQFGFWSDDGGRSATDLMLLGYVVGMYVWMWGALICDVEVFDPSKTIKELFPV